jgi:hypothetical protein
MRAYKTGTLVTENLTQAKSLGGVATASSWHEKTLTRRKRVDTQNKQEQRSNKLTQGMHQTGHRMSK